MACAEVTTEPQDPDEISIYLPSECGQGLVVWPVEEYRVVIRRDTVQHEYDECLSVLVYYEPEVEEESFPPCWGHGGGWITDFGDGTWECLDGTVRRFEEGVSRPYDGAACVGLELGCAYGLYRYVIPPP